MDDRKAFSSSTNDQKAPSSSNDGQQALSSSINNQQAISLSMDNQQISSSSLDGQQEHNPQPYDESWFDLANSCGKEFELPKVSDPMSLDLSINSNNLLVSPFQRLDIPCVLDDAFVLEMTGPSSAGNQLASLPLIEMVPSVTNTFSAIDQQSGSLNSTKDSSVEYNFSVPIGNLQMHFARSSNLSKSDFFHGENRYVDISSTDSFSLNGMEIGLSLTNQKLYAVDPSKSPSFSLIDSWCLHNNFTRIPSSGNTPWLGPDICIPSNIASPSNASQLGSDICILKDHTHISSIGCSSSLEANGSPNMSYQLIGSSNFADAPCFLSSRSCIISNGEVGVPVTSNTLGFSANGYEHDGPEHLQNSNHRRGIRSNLSILMKSQGVSPTHAPLSNFCGSEGNRQTFGTSSLQVGQPSSYNGEVSYFSHLSRVNGEIKYICKDCQKEFPNYNAFGGHMSFHAKARKMIRKLSSPTNASQKHSIVSSCLMEAADKKLEVNNFSNKAKGKLVIRSVIPSEEESAVEKLSPSDDLVKEDFCQLHKRAREGALLPKNITENKTSSLCKAQNTEPSSPMVEQNGNKDPPASDDHQHSPSH